ncbi:MAG: DUF1778 domain-containing protein [Xanthomonadales bacterium]|nr:DUF1778 domain-containing protein [Xanthomonadales bacterium]
MIPASPVSQGTQKTSDARLDLRLGAHDKALLEQAARLRGMRVSAFVRSAALREARDVLAAEAVMLSPAESQRFIRALNRPLELNSRLTEALEQLTGVP